MPAAVLAFAASISLWLLLSNHSPIFGDKGYFDLNVYRGGANSVLAGRALYGAHTRSGNFTYPPSAALLFTPLALMPLWMAKLLVTALSFIGLPALMWCALAMEPVVGWLSAPRRRLIAVVAAAAAVWLEPVLTTLRYGQIDLVLAALVVCDISRADDARGKGVMVGLAAGLKLTPLIFVPYLLLTRRPRAGIRALLAFAATVAAGFAVLPRDAARYWDGTFLDASRVGRLQNSANQSLLGAIARLLHSVHVQPAWLVVAVGVGAGGLALGVLAARRGDEAAGFSLCAITGLLVSPISWTHHWVIAAPGLLLLTVAACRAPSPTRLCVAAALWLIGYSQITWTIPRAEELRLGAAHLVYADAYVVSAVAALTSVASARARRTIPAGGYTPAATR